MEAEILKEMIEDREQCITMIQRKSEEQSTKESRLRQDLDEVQEKNTTQKIQLHSEKTTLLHKKQQVSEQLESLQRSLQEQGNSIKGYANAVQHDQKIDDSSYVMRMQAQLCKAMHSMGIMEHQVELARKHSQTITKIQKDALSQLTDEMSQMELQLMNTLMKYDTEKRDIEMELKSKADEIQKDTDAVQRQIDENTEDESDEDESEEDESEDEEEKDSCEPGHVEPPGCDPRWRNSAFLLERKRRVDDAAGQHQRAETSASSCGGELHIAP